LADSEATVSIETPSLEETLSPSGEKKVEGEEKIEKQILGKELPIYNPVLKQELEDKFKANFQEIQILRLCNGQHSFSDIVTKSSQAEDIVYEFLEKHFLAQT
jgi:hypothetical protein